MTRSCESEESLETYMRRQVARRLKGRMYKLLPGITKGIPDRLVLLPGGRIFLVELKAEDGEASPAQKNLHRQMAELGTDVVMLTGRPEVEAWIADQDILPRRMGEHHD